MRVKSYLLAGSAQFCVSVENWKRESVERNPTKQYKNHRLAKSLSEYFRDPQFVNRRLCNNANRSKILKNRYRQVVMQTLAGRRRAETSTKYFADEWRAMTRIRASYGAYRRKRSARAYSAVVPVSGLLRLPYVSSVTLWLNGQRDRSEEAVWGRVAFTFNQRANTEVNDVVP